MGLVGNIQKKTGILNPKIDITKEAFIKDFLRNHKTGLKFITNNFAIFYSNKSKKIGPINFIPLSH
jgi:hypothetical protein